MLHTKFQGLWSIGSGEEDFLRFLPYIWAMQELDGKKTNFYGPIGRGKNKLLWTDIFASC